MSVFLYAPGVKVYIYTEKNGTLDISEDLVDGTLARRSDGVSTFTFDLQNARRKYDGVFAPNDRIVVMMKRVTWLRVFTGYLNQVPLITAWPQTVQMSASCSLKRLQYWYMDAGTQAFQSLVAGALASSKSQDDGGTSNAVLAILNSVVGWPASNVHIAGIPQSWFTFAYKIAKNVQAEAAEADALAQNFYAQLDGSGTVGGVTAGSAVPAGKLPAGPYGGITITQDQANVAALVYNVGASLGATTRDCTVAIMTAMDESALGANPQTNAGNGGSYGIFQQVPGDGWGTQAQVMNDSYAATAFYKVLLKITNRDSMQLYQEAQAVQHSATASGSNYEQFQQFAIAIVNVLAGGSGGAAAGTAPPQAGKPPKTSAPSSTTTGKATGADLLATAQHLAATQQVPYQWGGDSPPNDPDPTALDCSSAQQWIRYQTLGTLGGMPRVVDDQYSWCQKNGTIVTADQGMRIRGALMFMGPVAALVHIEMSCGDGVHTIGSHHSGTYFGEVSSQGAWSTAALQPDIDFSADGGVSTTSGGTGGTSSIQVSTVNTQPWYDPNDPFDKLFGASPWVPQYSVNVESQALTGVRALLNDQPLLPYLKNLLNSTMRSFSSAPNGDFIAWFPDYYGIWGTAAAMQIEPIELQDFTVYWSDDFFVTHQFTVAPYTTGLALDTLESVALSPLLDITTDGIATIDIPAIMYALFGLEPTKAQAANFISYIYKRFGARPDFQQLPGVVGPQGEFFSALFLFMRQWAYQYNADIPVTFMPEMWPGMLTQIPEFDFQAYVTTVTHQFSFGSEGGFSTTINVAAPARLSGGSLKGLVGLPIAGGLGVTP
jgi:hypothetical protein